MEHPAGNGRFVRSGRMTWSVHSMGLMARITAVMTIATARLIKEIGSQFREDMA
jgi:hypothetical protein